MYNDTDGELADVHAYLCCECTHCLQQTAIYMGSYFPLSGTFDHKTVSFVILIPTEFKTVIELSESVGGKMQT